MINNGNGSIDLFMNHVFAIDMVKANQQLDGFCTNQSFSPVITNITTTITTDVMGSFNTNFQIVALNWPSVTQSLSTYFECSSNAVNEIDQQVISLYPVPADDNISVDGLSKSMKQIIISDVTGKILLDEWTLNSSLSLSIQTFPNNKCDYTSAG